MSRYSRTMIQQRKSKRARSMVKRTSPRTTRRLKTATIAGLVLALVGIFTFFTLNSASAQSTPPLSAAKQQLEQSQAQWHALVDKNRALKGTLSPRSCPVDLHHAPVINRLTPAQMATMHNAYASFASVISAEGKPYFIFGENGKFVVQALSLDPCKTNSASQTTTTQAFQNPLHQGNLMIQSVQGDLLTYQTASGVTGLFNYVTGQFQQ